MDEGASSADDALRRKKITVSMKITLQYLILRNFKGTKFIRVDFGNVTNIYGENRSGKTTINDAFWWLLFGKDSAGRTDFEIKTKNEDGTTIHQLEHEVTGMFNVDGRSVLLKRMYKEKWVKKRGSGDHALEGHTTDFFVDEIPVQAGEYKKIIDGIVSEELLKMITSPGHFCSMKWQDQRSALEKMAGDIPLSDISSQVEGLEKLMSELSGKTIAQFKSQKSVQKKPLKEELETIPARIDEVDRTKPVALQWAVLEKRKSEIEAEISGLRDNLANHSGKYEELHKKNRSVYNEIQNAEGEISRLKSDVQKAHDAEVSKMNRILSALTLEKNTAANDLLGVEAIDNQRISSLERLENEILTLREDYKKIASRPFEIPSGQTNCPACNQELPDAEIEMRRTEIEKRMRDQRKAELEAINEKGIKKAQDRDHLLKQIEESTVQKEVLQEKIISLEKDIDAQEGALKKIAVPPEAPVSDILLRIESLKAELQEIPEVDNSEEKKILSEKESELQTIINELNIRQIIEKADARISQLQDRQRELSQQIADIESMEFLAEKYEMVRADLIEKRVSSMFSLVKFRMFNRNLNGGIEPTCECTLNGVSYTDLNTEARMNIGLDIINALCRHYDVYAPIFLDNRESVLQIIPTDSQVVNLVVKENQKAIQIQIIS